MINVEGGQVEYYGDLDVITSEASIALKMAYDMTVREVSKEFADMWLDDLPRIIKMTEEELIDEVWGVMMEGDEDELYK